MTTVRPTGEEKTVGTEMVERYEVVPDTSKSLRTGSPQIKRPGLRGLRPPATFGETKGHVEISATVAEKIARALEDSDGMLAKVRWAP
jgi:hypothetical protein